MPQHTPAERAKNRGEAPDIGTRKRGRAVRKRLKKAGLKGEALRRATALGTFGSKPFGGATIGPKGIKVGDEDAFDLVVRLQRFRGGSAFHGSVGDKAPAGVTNHADRMRKDVVQAIESEKRQTFTADLLDESGVAPSSAIRTTK